MSPMGQAFSINCEVPDSGGCAVLDDLLGDVELQVDVSIRPDDAAADLKLVLFQAGPKSPRCQRGAETALAPAVAASHSSPNHPLSPSWSCRATKTKTLWDTFQQIYESKQREMNTSVYTGCTEVKNTHQVKIWQMTKMCWACLPLQSFATCCSTIWLGGVKVLLHLKINTTGK